MAKLARIIYYSDHLRGMVHATRSLHDMGINYGKDFSYFGCMTSGVLEAIREGSPQLVFVEPAIKVRAETLVQPFCMRNSQAVVVVLEPGQKKQSLVFGEPQTPEDRWFKVNKEEPILHLLAEAFNSGVQTCHGLLTRRSIYSERVKDLDTVV